MDFFTEKPIYLFNETLPRSKNWRYYIDDIVLKYGCISVSQDNFPLINSHVCQNSVTARYVYIITFHIDFNV